MTKLCFISDTHGSQHEVTVPECDILVHCGDLTADGGNVSTMLFLQWLERQPAAHKVLIAGNHDWYFQKHNLEARTMVEANCPGCHYLEDSGCEIMGLRFWGSPYTPTFMDWYFMADRGGKIKAHWDLIPEGTDVLVTHGPPYGLGDACPGWNPVRHRREGIAHAGCQDLLEALHRVKPAIHAFGHIHAGHGAIGYFHATGEPTTIVNASVLDEDYRCTHLPIVVELNEKNPAA